MYVEGYLKTRSWESPEGVKKFKTEVVVQDMIMLDKRPQGEEGGESSQTDSAPSEPAMEAEMPSDTEENIF